jgi:Transglycosylase SLT domain
MIKTNQLLVISNLNGKCMDSDSPRLLKTSTAFRGVSSLTEGSKYMLLHLANIYGTRVNEAMRPQILPYSAETKTPSGIEIQVRTFQKLSIDNLDFFGELLIRILCDFWFKIYNYIVPRLSMFCKGIKQFFIGFLVLMCANCANANESLSLAKNEIKQLISSQEKQHNIPSGLLLAIAKVESNVEAYALNIQGKPVIKNNKPQAASLVYEALEEGITNIDVGVMQLNVKWHQENFSSIEEMLDPKKNIEYAASFLLKLHKKYGDWHKAVRFYHSSTHEYHRKYSKKITLAWIGG